jgi:ABC-type transport system substrate-binding protein
MDRRWIENLLLLMILLLMLYFVATQPVFGESTPVLSFKLIASTADPITVQCAQLVANELPKIGIEPNLRLISWSELETRVFKPSGSLALSYADGGYDMAFIRGSGGLLPTTQYWLFHSSFTPDPNYFGVQDSALDAMLELTVNTTDIAQRKQHIEEVWQYLTWQVQAEIVLYQHEEVVLMRNNVRGYSSDLRVPGALGIAEMYFEDGQSQGHGQQNEFIMAGTMRPTVYNDLIENDRYNQLVIGSHNHGLVERDRDYDFFPVLLTKLPYPVAVVNNHTDLLSPTAPNTATVWEIELRDDVFWHEGYGYTMAEHMDILQVDADDVLFTFGLILDDSGPSPCAARFNWQRLLGNDLSLSVIKKDRYHVQLHLQTVDADFMAYLEQHLLPQHILTLGITRADGSVAPSDYADWSTDDWNLGHRTGRYTGPAVIGNGPYVLWPGEDSNTQTITETKNPYWHLINEAIYAYMFDKYIYRCIPSLDAVLDALEEAEIDLITSVNAALVKRPWIYSKPRIIFIQKSLDWDCQTIGINTAHGAGGLTDHWVRLAISHMIPRQEMVDTLLAGLGQPAFMHFPKQNPFYPDDIEPIRYNITRALEYMETAGYDMTPFRNDILTDSASGFETLVFFIALGGMATVVLVYRHKKRVK